MRGAVGEVVGQVVDRDRLAVVLAQEGRGTQGQGLLSGERLWRPEGISTADAHGHPRQSRRRRTCGDQHVRMSSRPTRMGPSFPVRAMDEEDKRFLPLSPAADPLTADMPHGWSAGRSEMRIRSRSDAHRRLSPDCSAMVFRIVHSRNWRSCSEAGENVGRASPRVGLSPLCCPVSGIETGRPGATRWRDKQQSGGRGRGPYRTYRRGSDKA